MCSVLPPYREGAISSFCHGTCRFSGALLYNSTESFDNGSYAASKKPFHGHRARPRGHWAPHFSVLYPVIARGGLRFRQLKLRGKWFTRFARSRRRSSCVARGISLEAAERRQPLQHRRVAPYCTPSSWIARADISAGSRTPVCPISIIFLATISARGRSGQPDRCLAMLAHKPSSGG
jgi:hypothetical protein